MTLERFDDLVNEGRALLRIGGKPRHAQHQFQRWEEGVTAWLQSSFPNSSLSATWASLGTPVLHLGDIEFDEPLTWKNFHDIVQNRLIWLGKIAYNTNLTTHKRQSLAKKQLKTSDVFVVHGHNNALKTELARFLEKLGLNPIILHEQPDKGRTIIEKFESYSTVSFAVILLTSDDLGRSKKTSDKEEARARQNVIFELGYFIGKLGRASATAIYEAGVEIPSDFEGVLYIPLDEDGNWKLNLAKEIKAAGVPVDLNKLV